MQTTALEIPPLPVACVPIDFCEDTVEKDTLRICREFRGTLTGRKGREVIVTTDRARHLPNLIFVRVFDRASHQPIGRLPLLFIPQVKEMGVNFFDLTALQGEGIGLQLVQAFSGFMPPGMVVTCWVEERQTREQFLVVLDELMKTGRVTDWRRTSGARPKAPVEGILPLREPDQKLLTHACLELWPVLQTPIRRLYDAMHAKPLQVRAALDYNDHILFQLIAEIQK